MIGDVLRRFVSWNRGVAEKWVSRYPEFFAVPASYRELDQRLAESLQNLSDGRVLECGGIDRPLLGKGRGFLYDGLDIEMRPECSRIYDTFFVQSVEERLPEEYDLIVSRTLMEHVPDNHRAWKSIYEGLKPGGKTVHYVPCGNHPYSLATRLVGNRLQRRMIRVIRAGTENETGYPAYYHLCTPGRLERKLRELGFVDVRVQSFWDAEDYFRFFAPLFLGMTCFNRACRRFGWRFFASGMVVSATRPQ